MAERLIADGAEVRGVDRFSDYYSEARKRANLTVLGGDARFELVEGNLTEIDLDALLDQIDVVFHLSGQPGVRASWGSEFQIYLEDNVRSTQLLLEATRDRELDRFVYASSSSIYGDADTFPTPESQTPSPISPYGVTKLAGEHLCNTYQKNFGVPSVAVRYFTVFGPRQRPDMAMQRFIEAGIVGEPLTLYGSGEQRRDFTFVDDAVAGTIAAAKRGREGASYNLAGGNRASVNDVIETIQELLGTEIAIDRRGFAKGDARQTGGDITRARQELGYEPSTPLREGLRLQVEECRRQDRSADG